MIQQILYCLNLNYLFWHLESNSKYVVSSLESNDQSNFRAATISAFAITTEVIFATIEQFKAITEKVRMKVV